MNEVKQMNKQSKTNKDYDKQEVDEQNKRKNKH